MLWFSLVTDDVVSCMMALNFVATVAGGLEVKG